MLVELIPKLLEPVENRVLFATDNYKYLRGLSGTNAIQDPIKLVADNLIASMGTGSR